MAWKCLDCGNKSSRQFPGGRCPACDSFNVEGVGKKKNAEPERSERRKKIDVAVLILCWGSLAVLLLNKLLSN